MHALSFASACWLLLMGAVGPTLLALRFQKKHWINIPIWDEWDTPGKALLLDAQGAITWSDLFAQHNAVAAIASGIVRPDVARSYGPALLKAGFDQDLETSRLPPEAATLRAWAADLEAQRAFRVDGVVTLDRPH
jgi:hypothetical protein